MENKRVPKFSLKETLLLFANGDYEQCISSLEIYANEGEIEACSNLGLACQLGLGIAIDHERAIVLLTYAGHLGSGVACHNLATLYATLPNKNNTMARYWFEQARNLGFNPGTD